MHTAEKLTIPGQYTVAEWFGDPLTHGQAGQLMSSSMINLRVALSESRSCFPSQLLGLISRFWLGCDIRSDYISLKAAADTDTEHALLELIFGQLLISRKLKGADRYLASGFSMAGPLLLPGDYFRLVKRHDLLRGLPLSDTPAVPGDLQALLSEAVVIRQLCSRKGFIASTEVHSDTIG